MADLVDHAQRLEERQRAAALARAGVSPRVTEIPAPHFDGQPEACRECAGPPEVGALCGPCNCKPNMGDR